MPSPPRASSTRCWRERAPEPASAALLFSCNGRGRNLFAQPDHDAGAVARALGTDAVVGCFCQGELGPVGDRTFVHAFTASVALW